VANLNTICPASQYGGVLHLVAAMAREGHLSFALQGPSHGSSRVEDRDPEDGDGLNISIWCARCCRPLARGKCRQLGNGLPAATPTFIPFFLSPTECRDTLVRLKNGEWERLAPIHPLTYWGAVGPPDSAAVLSHFGVYFFSAASCRKYRALIIGVLVMDTPAHR
jgi:hypothetical protein